MNQLYFLGACNQRFQYPFFTLTKLQMLSITVSNDDSRILGVFANSPHSDAVSGWDIAWLFLNSMRPIHLGLLTHNIKTVRIGSNFLRFSITFVCKGYGSWVTKCDGENIWLRLDWWLIVRVFREKGLFTNIFINNNLIYVSVRVFVMRFDFSINASSCVGIYLTFICGAPV